MLAGYKDDSDDENKPSALYQREYDGHEDDEEQQMQRHEEDQIQQKGFEERIDGEQDIFIFKNMVLPGISQKQKINKFAVSEQTKILITDSNKIYRWRDKKQAQFRSYELPDINKEHFLALLTQRDKSLAIKHVYLDSKGYHCILIGQDGNNFYLNYRDNKIRLLPKLKGVNIKALAFHSSGTQTKSGDIIFSTENGIISLYRIELTQNDVVESLTPSILQVFVSADITSIQILRLVQNQQGNYVIIIFSTLYSIFCITGPDDVEVLLNRYRDHNQKVKQVPMPKGYQCLIHVCYSKLSSTNRPTSMIWTNGNNLIHFRIPDADEKVTDNFLARNQIYKFAKKDDLPNEKAYQMQQLPINIGITDFHYYILFQESITILSTVTQKIVMYQEFKGALVKDMIYQQNTGIFWIFSNKGVTKLDTSKEGLQAWKLLIVEKKYKQAYNVCKAKNQNLSYVAGLYADDLFAKKEYLKAATLFSQTSRSFEEIFLKFLKINSDAGREGLQLYLKAILKQLTPDMKTQRCLLISWLIQLIIYRLNNLQRNKMQLQGQNSAQIKKKLQEKKTDLETLLDNNMGIINESLVYLIMQSHGRIQNLINFADKKGNFEMIVIHYLNEQNYAQAIEYLKTVKDAKVAEVVYKYAHIFFRYETQKTVDLLKYSIRDFKPIKLMPGLMNIPDSQRGHGVTLLKYCVQELKNKEKSLHNILIFFYATSQKQRHSELIDMMKKGKLDFDLDFGLRLFKTHRISEAQIIVYGRMYLYSEAVSLALENNKEQLAKQYADKPDDEDQKKKLWIEIAKHYLVRKGKVSEVIQLAKQSQVIKIQDLLPHFNTNIKIQNFKDQICESLKTYSQQISKLKSLMDSYSANAQQLKNELRSVKNRCIQVDSNHQCQQCFKALFTKQFYIFPCMHGFHRQCLNNSIKQQPTFSRYKLEKLQVLIQQIGILQEKLLRKKQEQYNARQKEMNESSGFSFMKALNLNIWGSEKQQQYGNVSLNKEQEELKVKKQQIDTILAAECIYCGPGVVDTIILPFDNAAERSSWNI